MIHLLALATLGSAILAPIIAGVVIWSEREPRRSRAAAWLGVSIGVGTASTLPLFTLFLATAGQAWPYKLVAPLFGLAAMLLGVQIVRAHRQHLRGENKHLRSTVCACGVFGFLVAVALTPVISGAPPPAACGEFGAESCGPGTLRDYVTVVLPVLLAMGLETWTMLRRA